MEAERRVQGLPELNDSEKLNYLTSYEGFVN
jgi:hypothetical protein